VIVAAVSVAVADGSHGEVHQGRARRRGLDLPPYPGELGRRLFESVSKEGWGQWLEHQEMLVNENQLNLSDKKARDYLVQQMEKYFFGSGAVVATG